MRPFDVSTAMFAVSACVAIGREVPPELLKIIFEYIDELEGSDGGVHPSDEALSDICALLDAPEWEYPGQVVRDVAKAIGMSLEDMAVKLKKAFIYLMYTTGE